MITKKEYELLKQIKYYYPNCKKVQYEISKGFIFYTGEVFKNVIIPYRMLSNINTNGMVNIDKLIKEYEDVYNEK